MKRSWSLSCFGILGTRKGTFKGNINAVISIEDQKKITKKKPSISTRIRKSIKKRKREKNATSDSSKKSNKRNPNRKM